MAGLPRGVRAAASGCGSEASCKGVAPVFGTRFITSYEWSDATTLTPGHVYLTQKKLLKSAA